VWRSVFWAAVFGWFVLLAITFAAQDPAASARAAARVRVFEARSSRRGRRRHLIATIGQLFCGMAALTSASRMCYAFSRDRAVPGATLWTRLNHTACRPTPCSAWPPRADRHAAGAVGEEEGIPYAFFAVVSITVIGLYIAYVIPVYLRWRKGDAGSRALDARQKYKWVNPIAIVWVAISW
jgi:hypothetical protein